jgi:hypothetical protein
MTQLCVASPQWTSLHVRHVRFAPVNGLESDIREVR